MANQHRDHDAAIRSLANTIRMFGTIGFIAAADMNGAEDTVATLRTALGKGTDPASSHITNSTRALQAQAQLDLLKNTNISPTAVIVDADVAAGATPAGLAGTLEGRMRN